MTPDDPPQTPRPFDGFQAACRRHGSATALEIGDQHWTYDQLQDWVLRLAGLLAPHVDGSAPPRVGVLASRSLTAYGGTLAVLASGATFVALNPAYPVERNLAILQRAGIEVLVVGTEGLAAWEALQARGAAVRVLLAPQALLVPPADPSPIRVVYDIRDMGGPPRHALPAPPPDDALSYVVFTSGSTGEPKGVPITHRNLQAYQRNFRRLAPPHAGDRVATTYELTFDIALHDMLNAWWSGATLVVMPERAMLAPARFILDRRITVWFSVASFAMILQKQGLLRPGLFPQLRVSMLCGEALPMATALAWAAAAPHSELYNVWGPTETTMELSFYRWDREHSTGHCRRGVVPIGVPFADHRHLLLDDQGGEVVGPGSGELLVQGPQVGPGYWQDAERSAASFVTLPGRDGTWYRSGDRVERDVMGIYHFVSRIDFMVKIRGNRIELGEVEHALRRASGVDLVAVIPQPALDGLTQGLVAFVAAPGDPAALSAQLRERLRPLLPKAWLPDEIRVLETLPLNANRKIDRGALAAMLGGAAPRAGAAAETVS